MLNESVGTKESGYLHLGLDWSNTFLDVLFLHNVNQFMYGFPLLPFHLLLWRNSECQRVTSYWRLWEPSDFWHWHWPLNTFSWNKYTNFQLIGPRLIKSNIFYVWPFVCVVIYVYVYSYSDFAEKVDFSLHIFIQGPFLDQFTEVWGPTNLLQNDLSHDNYES